MITFYIDIEIRRLAELQTKRWQKVYPNLTTEQALAGAVTEICYRKFYGLPLPNPDFFEFDNDFKINGMKCDAKARPIKGKAIPNGWHVGVTRPKPTTDKYFFSFVDRDTTVCYLIGYCNYNDIIKPENLHEKGTTKPGGFWNEDIYLIEHWESLRDPTELLGHNQVLF